ncbi:MAG: hypothetical protein ACYYK0_02765 [Candidatus Eutrophobiaceae bacterium]
MHEQTKSGASQIQQAVANRQTLGVVAAAQRFTGAERIKSWIWSAWQGIVDYDPAELVSAVRTGRQRPKRKRPLAGQGQMLFPSLAFAPRSTIGRAVATAMAGRVARGLALRDYAGVCVASMGASRNCPLVGG